MANRTNREKKILNFIVAYDIMVVNTFFRKKKNYLITFNSDQGQIDFILTIK
jgi:hypothetical protein